MVGFIMQVVLLAHVVATAVRNIPASSPLVLQEKYSGLERLND